MPNTKRRRLRSRDIRKALGVDVFKVDVGDGAAVVSYLNRVRKGRRLTLKTLAAMLGTTEGNVSVRLQAKARVYRPNLPTLTRIASALGVAVILVPVDARGKTDPRLVIPPPAPPKAKGDPV